MSRFPSSIRFEYRECHKSNFTAGTWRKDFITLHWWGDPATKPQFDGVVSWFQNPAANVSIQYMVESGRITQMIPESAMAWHAGNSTANRHGIGIEVNPRLSDGDYEATAQLVAEIWRRRGKLPLRRHREFFGTSCPGTMDVARIQRRAEQIYTGTGSTAPAVTAPSKEKKPMSLTNENIKNIASAVVNDRSFDLNGNGNTLGWKVANTNRRVEQIWNSNRSLERSVSYLGQQNSQIAQELRELKELITGKEEK